MRSLLAASILILLLAPHDCGAYETDQFSHRLEPIEDSLVPLNAKVNQALEEIVRNWSGPRDDWKFVQAVFHSLGGYYWVDHIEKWATESPDIQRLHTSRSESIYQGHPFWATRVAAIFGVGPTIKLNGVLMGTDKLGHFFSQGKKFYRRWMKRPSAVLAALKSAYTEQAIFGQLTTGAYSNADLVANYEGFLFYRSLFTDDIVNHKPAILAWQHDHWVIQRPFTWADHVNSYWDEALNVSDFDAILYPHMKARLLTFCPDYYREPDKYSITVEYEASLKEKYRFLHLHDTSALRLDHLCPKDEQDFRAPPIQTH